MKSKKLKAVTKKTQSINDMEFADGLFQCHKTDTPLDMLFSMNGGVPKATNWMVVGDPGVGKSTVTLDVIANAMQNGSKVLFISAEMTSVDLKLYVDRYPKFGDIQIYFPQEEDDDVDMRKELRALLAPGWDLVLTDSFVELQSFVKESARLSTNAAEKFLLNLMYEHNLGKNEEGRFTSFLNIQQVNKSGVFVGSNKLKHMTTGMMEIRFVDEDTQEERYVVFSKNRRGPVGKRMFFDLSASGDVQYDTERFRKAEDLRKLKAREKETVKKQGLQFDKLFNLNGEKAEEE
jgi:DNA repair protein RadA/Sms